MYTDIVSSCKVKHPVYFNNHEIIQKDPEAELPLFRTYPTYPAIHMRTSDGLWKGS
jgi:hypothetical protein